MEKKLVDQEISSYIIRFQEEELKRIATELHEGIGQTLYGIYTSLGFLETGLDQPEMKQYMQETALLMEKTINEVRMLSVELYPPALEIGLVPAIKSYAKLFTSTYGIIVEIESSGTPQDISKSGKLVLFRVCQEALANIAKYADTSRASIIIEWEPSLVKMQIKDYGEGFDMKEALKKMSGLAAMKGRMDLGGGAFSAESEIGKGSTIKVSLPLEQPS
ncbi:ATP-binding protein [Bacillus sp. FJAT-27231]|uniref:sensor histidine kinase n=1 Tax=Bacillus sp. FJAT-27231 TaxID=1679168 RepID=UPI000670BFE9|nr:histidine kinase [Bacillus sp. FJAT-27231]KMY54265.1 ATP-binding protein [Bacillus sp. FJAT-27231]